MDINITNPVTKEKIGEVINGANSATPNDTDLVMSVESSVAKKNTWTQVKAFLKTYFDTVYKATFTENTAFNKNFGTGTSNIVEIGSALGNSLITSTDANGKLQTLTTATYPSLTELSRVKGLTSPVQTQLDNKVSYTMGAITSNFASPADSTTYYTYLGGGITLLIATQVGIQFAKTGTINTFQITGFHSTNASNESVSFYLRNVTTGTDYTITTSWDDSYGANTNITRTYTGLNIPIGNTTDKWILKIVTPSWGTNPTNWQFIFSYIIEF